MSWCCEDAERYRVLHDKWPVVSYGRKALVRRSLHSLYPTQLGGLAISFDHLHVLYMFYICFIYVLSCFITSEFQGSHSQTFRVSYLPGVFQARLTGKSVGSPAFESPLNGGDPTQAPLKAIRPVCGGKVGCWVLLSQTSPKWSQLLSSWGRFSYESYRSTYIWTRCHRN